MTDVRETGFKAVVRLTEARDRLREAVSPLDRTVSRPPSGSEEWVVAAPISAERNVPHYDRAAMDGFAVRAADTFGASDRTPERLRTGDGSVGAGEAVRVHTGSPIPDGADAVVMVEHVDRHEGEEALDVFDAVATGENVAPVGEDVSAGQRLYEPGHRLRPSDVGLLRSAGIGRVEVFERPRVAVVPTGDEVLGGGETGPGGAERIPEPGPGEVVETNGPTVARLIQRWGGRPTKREVVPDDPDAVRAAIERDLTTDVVVTTGGSSVGARDLVPTVVDDVGEILAHGVAVKPGHPVAIGVVQETPVVMLPGYPVACIVNAVQILRPAVKWTGHLPVEPHPTRTARLTRKVASEPGVRTFARVALDADEAETVATPTRVSGAGVLSSVALADGWVVVPEAVEGLDAGETVEVELWEWSS